MQNITYTTKLKNAIQLLEVEQADSEQLLKEQFQQTYESLKPVNLIKSTLKDMTSSTFLKESILGTGMGITTGFLTKKLVVAGSGNIFRKLLGSIVQFGVTSIVAKNPDAIISLGRFLIKKIPHKKDINSKKPC